LGVAPIVMLTLKSLDMIVGICSESKACVLARLDALDHEFVERFLQIKIMLTVVSSKILNVLEKTIFHSFPSK
jgi:hypothetical protein